jgi:hypothetical protein
VVRRSVETTRLGRGDTQRPACYLGHCTRPNSPGIVSSAHFHRAHRAKGNDDGQDTRIGLRAGGCRDHAQGQARHATGAAAPRSGNRDHASATAPGRAGAALSVMNSRRFPPPWTVEELDARFVFFDKGQGPSSTSY